MWEEKERGEELKLLWGKVKMARPRRPNQKSCNLCNQETLAIMRREATSIHIREELGGYCPH